MNDAQKDPQVFWIGEYGIKDYEYGSATKCCTYDHAQAEKEAAVAAAYEDAADECISYAQGLVDDNGSHWMKTTLPDVIRARTDADAQAALEARDKRVRADVLKELEEKWIVRDLTSADFMNEED